MAQSAQCFWVSDIHVREEAETIMYDIALYREEVQEFFDKMDRDFDGRLSFGEFMGEETPLEKVFNKMDKDGDGTITKEVNPGKLKCYKIVCFYYSGVYAACQASNTPTGSCSHRHRVKIFSNFILTEPGIGIINNIILFVVFHV